ncbi:tetratricopeptide repeat protein [Halomonas sp. EGI 63088]|uniref:Tetratricopeptide repeat protein n=1 Tax=Halomonas flagellata TaxID=2920385 RepID=A0ABS9RS87_9GAMM|nr:tetratricopeptide repeat protein [Halomonas flagellata]MCH4562707.1 tetratricopeptide repeat protein [Halomonas flagellata]
MLLADRPAEDLRRLLIALAEEAHPRQRQAFLDRLRHHCAEPGAADALPSDLRALGERLARLQAGLHEMAEAELQDWWDDEETCGPFQALMPEVFGLLDEAAECLRQGNAQAARDTYASIWQMLDIENDYGHRPSLEEVDEAVAREHAARYLRAVLLTTPPEQQVATMLQAAGEVRFSGIVSRPESLFCTLREIAGVELEPLTGWEGFLDAVVQGLGNPRSSLEEMWLREALARRQGIDGIARMARQAGARMPRLWLDWVRAAVRQRDPDQAAAIWREALQHFPRGAGIWRALADSILTAYPAHRVLEGEAIAFEALLANPVGHRLLTLYEAFTEAERREQGLREAALWLSEAARTGKAPVPAALAGSEAQAAVSDHDRDLMTPSRFERWPPLAVMAWWLVGEGQRAKALVSARDQAVGWSLGDSPRWALFACLPAVLTGRPASAIGPASHAVWQRLADAGSHYLDESPLAGASSHDREALPAADRLSHALVDAGQRYPLSVQEPPAWLEWLCDTATERCHAIVSNRHRKAYDRAATCIAVCVETASAMGRAAVGRALLCRVRQRYPRHTAFQRALDHVT